LVISKCGIWDFRSM